MKYSIIKATTGIQLASVWILGIITFLAIVSWPKTAYPLQNHSTNESVGKTEMTDEEIVEAINKKLAVDGIESANTQSFATNGIVTLDGTVLSLADKQHLRRIASGVRGVRGVVNQLDVKPSSLSDEQIHSAVTEQLKLNTATDAYELAVAVNDGTVTLSGKVESLAEKQLAIQVASEVRGVRAIHSIIEVEYSEDRSDREIQAEIVQRLTNDVWIDEQMLTVEVTQGIVYLKGKVATVDMKDQLGILALTAGVKSVQDDNVQVDASLTIVPKKRRPSTRLDFEIHRALTQSLRLDPRVDLRDLDMKVDAGVVRLAGSVGDLQSKLAAVNTARNVAGVATVIDKLQIQRTADVDDDVIQEQLGKAFNRTATLKYDQIKVHVQSGVVKLTGVVPSQYQRRRAAAIAHSLTGVVEVNNEMRIDNPRSDRSDFEIGLDIDRAMRWSPYLNITKLKFTIKLGVVSFSGTVANHRSLDLARAIAIDAGARDIISTDVTFAMPPKNGTNNDRVPKDVQ